MKIEQIAYLLGYTISDNGIVFKNGQPRHTWLCDGYLIFSITFKKGKSTWVKVHRFMAFIKYGKKLYNYPLVRHFDGNKLNNNTLNIVLGNCRDNYYDIPKPRRNQIKRKIAFTKIKHPVFLRNRLRVEWSRNGMTQTAIGLKYDIPRLTVADIVKYKTIF